MKYSKTKARYYSLKSRGLCTTCGVNKPREGLLTCRSCAIKKSEGYYRRTERIKSDLRQLRIMMEGENGKEPNGSAYSRK